MQTLIYMIISNSGDMVLLRETVLLTFIHGEPLPGSVAARTQDIFYRTPNTFSLLALQVAALQASLEAIEVVVQGIN